MDRLTDRNKELPRLNSDNATLWARVYEKLAAYEDSGLSPEEIESTKAALMGKSLAEIKELNGLSVERMIELAKAEAEGRLVVPPCKVGDTVWVTGKERIVECYVDEAYLDDDKRIEYLVSFDCNIDCEGCPFNSMHQDYHSGEYSCDCEYGNACISSADFGKTVFLTRDEAEKALEAQNG